MSRRSIGQALKDVAIKLAREAERYVGAGDAAPCAGCSHARLDHCGCGMVCLGSTDGGTAKCECQGFATKGDS